jgi:hypothetical protein
LDAFFFSMKRLSLLLLLFMTCGSCGRIVDRTIHLIPAGYVGEVYILHNIADGAPAKREGGAVVYEIPVDGVLRTQTPVGDGDFFYTRYFFVNSRGERTRISEIWDSTIPDTPENRADNTVGVAYPVTGTFRDNEKGCEVRYEGYYVGTKSYVLANNNRRGLSDYLDQHPVCK